MRRIHGMEVRKEQVEAHAEVGEHRALVGAAGRVDQDVVQLHVPVHLRSTRGVKGGGPHRD